MSYHAYHPTHGTLKYTSIFDVFSFGNTGVQLFYVLSGFLLCLPYARWLNGLQARPSTWRFYERRILRVGPAYWVNIVVLFLFSYWTLAGLKILISRIFYVHNIFSHDLTDHAGVLWTMAVEVQFYAVLPLLAAAMSVLVKAIYSYTGRLAVALFFAVSLVLGGCEVLSVICETLSKNHAWKSISLLAVAPDALFDSNSMPYWLGVFAVGMGCSFLYVRATQIGKQTSDQRQFVGALGSAVFTGGVLIAFEVALGPLVHVNLPYYDLVFGGIYGLVVIGVLLGVRQIRLPFESLVLRFIGHISYSLYLWHLVVLEAIEPHITMVTNPRLHMLVGFGLDVAIAVPLAYVSFLLTERPFFSLRRRAREKPTSSAPDLAPVQAYLQPVDPGISTR
jgi:peptidoglycan/LPS O-acetylase OafA/YrhL